MTIMKEKVKYKNDKKRLCIKIITPKIFFKIICKNALLARKAERVRVNVPEKEYGLDIKLKENKEDI